MDEVEELVKYVEDNVAATSLSLGFLVVYTWGQELGHDVIDGQTWVGILVFVTLYRAPEDGKSFEPTNPLGKFVCAFFPQFPAELK